MEEKLKLLREQLKEQFSKKSEKWSSGDDFLNKLSFELKEYARKIRVYFKTHKQSIWALIILALACLWGWVYSFFYLRDNLINLNRQAPQLENINHYDTNILKVSDYTKEDLKSMLTVQDVIEYNTDLTDEVWRYNDYIAMLEIPYTYFLKDIYLPSLNIWRDPFTTVIDTDIFGEDFLNSNSYDDIKLVQKWSSFFKDMGENNEANEISNISVDNIIEEWDYFKIPINVTFVSNSKRSFLMLVDKLSMTSNKENISLINEFFYYLRVQIKEDKMAKVQKIYEELMAGSNEKAKESFMTNGQPNYDKVIGYHINEWIFNDKPNILVDKKLLDFTVRNVAACSSENQDMCYYKFREKYRTLPQLAHIVWFDTPSKNSIDKLKEFILLIPPVISIEEFTFDKFKGQDTTSANAFQYQWQIVINVYGRSILEEELNEISKELWEQCLTIPDTSLTPTSAIEQIDILINQIWRFSKIDLEKSKSLSELKNIIEWIDEKYHKLSNYTKTIRLFEIYRMLLSSNLCDI